MSSWLNRLGNQIVIGVADDFEEEAEETDAPVKFIPCADETELLTQFWEVAKKYDSVVTFNGRGFDVPFIYLRSALRCPA